jgi:hypothetical protein
VEEGLADLLTPDGVVQVFGKTETPVADFVRHVLPVLRGAPPSRIARESGVPATTVNYARQGRMPERHARSVLTSWAYDHAGEELLARGIEPPTDATQRFESYREHAPAWRICQAPGCDNPLPPGRRIGCRDAHTLAARRVRQTRQLPIARERATSFPVTGKAATAAAPHNTQPER